MDIRLLLLDGTHNLWNFFISHFLFWRNLNGFVFLEFWGFVVVNSDSISKPCSYRFECFCHSTAVEGTIKFQSMMAFILFILLSVCHVVLKTQKLGNILIKINFWKICRAMSELTDTVVAIIVWVQFLIKEAAAVGLVDCLRSSSLIQWNRENLKIVFIPCLIQVNIRYLAHRVVELTLSLRWTTFILSWQILKFILQQFASKYLLFECFFVMLQFADVSIVLPLMMGIPTGRHIETWRSTRIICH